VAPESDTGLRDITTKVLMPTGATFADTSGTRATLRRVGQVVSIGVGRVTIATPSASTFIALPAGWGQGEEISNGYAWAPISAGIVPLGIVYAHQYAGAVMMECLAAGGPSMRTSGRWNGPANVWPTVAP
jgi:hypothetical protein